MAISKEQYLLSTKCKKISSLMMFLTMAGCATQSVSFKNKTELKLMLSEGQIELSCGLSCASRFGVSRPALSKYYRNEDFESLLISVSEIGFSHKLSYFYLGAIAQKYGYEEAALKYYNISENHPVNCEAGLFSDACDGIFYNDGPELRIKQIILMREQKERAKEIAEENKIFAEKLAEELRQREEERRIQQIKVMEEQKNQKIRRDEEERKKKLEEERKENARKIELEKDRQRKQIERERCLSSGQVGICQASYQNQTINVCNSNPLIAMENILNPYCYRIDRYSVMTNIEIRNNNPFPIKDITFECTQYGRSGTPIVSGSKTFYDVFSSNVVYSLNLKFTKHDQLSGMHCTIKSWKR